MDGSLRVMCMCRGTSAPQHEFDDVSRDRAERHRRPGHVLLSTVYAAHLARQRLDRAFVLRVVVAEFGERRVEHRRQVIDFLADLLHLSVHLRRGDDDGPARDLLGHPSPSPSEAAEARTWASFCSSSRTAAKTSVTRTRVCACSSFCRWNGALVDSLTSSLNSRRATGPSRSAFETAFAINAWPSGLRSDSTTSRMNSRPATGPSRSAFETPFAMSPCPCGDLSTLTRAFSRSLTSAISNQSFGGVGVVPPPTPFLT